MSETNDLLSQLRAPGTTLTKTISAVNALENLVQPTRQVTLGISSNVSVDLISVYLRKHALLCGARVGVRIGNHDDPVTVIEELIDVGAPPNKTIFVLTSAWETPSRPTKSASNGPVARSRS